MKFIPQGVTQMLARQALLSQKNSPTILFGAGVVGTVGSTVLACRATLKVESVLNEIESEKHVTHSVKERVDNGGAPEGTTYTDKEYQKDLTLITVRGVVQVAKLYAPAVVLGAASIAALTSAHNILNRRNAALTAAYAVVEKAFGEYRDRVIEKYGEDQDREFRFPREKVTELNEATGRNHTVVRVAGEAPSMYARFFDQMSSSWNKEPEYNLAFLRAQQNWCNDILQARGHLFLNEVYDVLGLERSSPGSVVGWVLSQDGDNYVDFGIFNGDSEQARAFVNGAEGSVLLDFNVDGVIFDKIGNTKGGALSWQKGE